MPVRLKQDQGSVNPLAAVVSTGFQANDLAKQRDAELARQARQTALEEKKSDLIYDPLTKSYDFTPDKKTRIQTEDEIKNLEKKQKTQGLMNLQNEYNIQNLNKQAKESQIPFETLPPEKQAIVKGIGDSVQKLSGYSNLLKAGLAKVMDTSQSQDQRLQTARQLIKTLNTAAVGNSDAVGQEEAKRLGSFLEFHILNFRDPGPVFGRAPIEEFGKQVQNKIDELDYANKLNMQNIDEAYGRKTPGLIQQQVNNLNSPIEKQKNQNAGNKPKQVIQNGHTYILNEASGQYE